MYTVESFFGFRKEMVADFLVHCHSTLGSPEETSAGCQPSLKIRKMFSDCGWSSS